MMARSGVATAIALLLPSGALGGPGEVGPMPCRPTIACTAEFVPAGYAEVEVGYAASRLGVGYQHTTPLLLKVTASEDLQLQLGTNGPVLQPDRDAYLDNWQLLAKLRLTRENGGLPALALSAAISIPSEIGGRDYHAAWNAQGVAYASKNLGPLHADLNVAVNFLDLGRGTSVQPWAALSVSSDVGLGLTPMIELYQFWAAEPDAVRDAGLLLALGYAITPWLVMDVGGDVGLGAQDRSFTLFAGFTALTPRLWRPQARRD